MQIGICSKLVKLIRFRCDNPVEVMRQKCKEYHVCYSTPASLKLKVSNVVLNILGQAANTLMGSAGLAGTIFITCLVCAVLFFAYKSSKGVMILKQNWLQLIESNRNYQKRRVCGDWSGRCLAYRPSISSSFSAWICSILRSYYPSRLLY